jgi:hypothetical protein
MNQRRNRNATPLQKGQICVLCEKNHATTVDHFIPLASKLPIATTRINLIPACKACNTAKGGRWPTDSEAAKYFQYWRSQIDQTAHLLLVAKAVQRGEIELVTKALRRDQTGSSPEERAVRSAKQRLRRPPLRKPAQPPRIKLTPVQPRPPAGHNKPITWENGLKK